MKEKKNMSLRKKIITSKINKLAELLILDNETDENGKFELPGYDGVYNISMNNAPKWFQEFQKTYTKDISEIKTDVAELKTDVSELKTKVDKNTSILKKHFPEDFK